MKAGSENLDKETFFEGDSELKDFIEKMPGGFFIYHADADEKIIYANDITLDIFGCETFEEFSELVHGSFRGLVHPEDYKKISDSIDRQVAESSRNLDYVEYRIIRKDGQIRYLDDYGRLVHTEKYGDVYYVFIRDVTEIFEERRENIRRAKVIEGLSAEFSSIFLFNLEKDIIKPYRLQDDFSKELAEKFNVTPTGFIDRQKMFSIYAQEHVIPEDAELFLYESSRDRIVERIQNENSYTVTYRSTDGENNLTYMEMSVVSIEEKIKPYVVTGFRDVTETIQHLGKYVVTGFRDVTAIIKKIQRELEEKINMQTELDKERHENEIKSSFLFSISHDIRTPMNSIMGFTELAKKHVNYDAEMALDYLNKVGESNKHMLALIDDLLEMSRINYGKIEIKSAPCNLREQFEIIFGMFKLWLDEKHIDFEKNLELPDKDVLTDELSFRRVISNLLDNAIKFTPDGGKIKISAKQKKISDVGYARFEFKISDNGAGMSEEFLQKIFTPFAREKTSTESGYGGTGLGLAITKKLLDIMGGTIKVDSKKGEGTEFTIELPLKLVDHTQAKKEIASAVQIEKAAGEYRILLVEDIEINRLLAETILTDSGFIVESVVDGSDAVEAVKNHPPQYYDLILMDIQMPVMNGYEATRLIRSMDREDTKILPIVALSANARDEDKRMSLESGMNAHVAKPFDIANLIFTINSFVC